MRPASCSTRIHFSSGVAIVALEGELDVATAPSLEVVVDTFAGTLPRLVLDLRHLQFMDSFGYRALVRCINAAHHRGTEVRLDGVRGEPALVVAHHQTEELLAEHLRHLHRDQIDLRDGGPAAPMHDVVTEPQHQL